MKSGIAAIQKTMDDRAKTQGGSRPQGGLGYASWKDGDVICLRFLSPDPIEVGFHEFVFGHDKEKYSFICAPDLYSDDPHWVGEDWVLKYGGKTEDYATKDIGPSQPKTRAVAIAVLREEVSREVDGKTVIGFQDVLTEVEVDGVTFPSRKFVIVKQSLGTFWEPVIGFGLEYGTICDRDYKITRSGVKNTSYRVIPKQPDQNFSIDELHAQYGYGTGTTVGGEKLTADHPDRFLYCPQTLWEWAESQASEGRAKYLLLGPDGDREQTNTPGRYTPSGMDEFSKDNADEAQAARPPTATDFADLRARIEAHKK